MTRKIKFNKSTEVIVRQWLVSNKKQLGVSLTSSAYQLKTSETQDGLFSFTWNGVSGTIECKSRVLTSTLKINA